MKSYLLLLALALATCLGAKAEELISESFILKDPRGNHDFYEWIKDGKEIDNLRAINNSLLIVCRAPDSDGNNETFEINGIPGQHSAEHMSRLLKEFYEMEFGEGVSRHNLPLNIVLVGNNWGSGLTLKPTLLSLSKKHSFSVFYSSHFFQKTELLREPEARRKLLQKANGIALAGNKKN